ncbi:MAG: ABC transporter ATP-binding protein, partial [Burkholderiaceae bacterium]
MKPAVPLLAVDDLVAGYGAIRVLHGLSLRVAAGGVTALLGANGAGKTTLMKTLAGLVPVDAGCIALDGRSIATLPCDRRVSAGMVLVPEGRMVFPNLSVRENLRLGGISPRARPSWRRNLDRVYALFPRLAERKAQAAATLSGGEQQMLAIGRGLMAEPALMLLDEPTLGLA